MFNRLAIRRALWLFALFFLAMTMVLFRPSKQVIPPVSGKSEAIVLLAGNYQDKIGGVAQLFHRGAAGLVLLTNDGVKSRWSREYQRNLYNVEWAEEGLVAKGVPRSVIVQLPFKKSGTIHDAQAVRDYVLNHGIKSVILATFDFHVKRVCWAFERVFQGTPVAIQVHGLALEEGKVGRRTQISEIVKLGYYRLRYGLVALPVFKEAVKQVADPRLPANLPPVLNSPYGPLPVFPADNPWNQEVANYPVHPNSKNFIHAIGAEKPLHPDFGSEWQGVPLGIPFVVVNGEQKKVPVRFQYAAESDPGPYPIPADASIEGGESAKGDRHVIVIDYGHKTLYELFAAYKEGDGWRAGSGAIFDLTSNKLRPAGWTSADAAGLPIFPGLVRYDEVVEEKEIRHALRFTVEKTQKAYIEPARHFASDKKDKNRPPMGLRLRLKADYDISGFPANVQVILRGLKRYGMILADNGGDWFISGAHDKRWDNEELGEMKRVRGSDFEVVYTGEKEM